MKKGGIFWKLSALIYVIWNVQLLFTAGIATAFILALHAISAILIWEGISSPSLGVSKIN